MPENPPTRAQRRLRQLQREYDAIKARIQEVGFVCTGSLVERWISCGKPNCHCAQDPAKRHGPYYQLSWKEAGVTVSRRLEPEHAKLYKEWIENRRQLEDLVQGLQHISAKAAPHLLASSQPGSEGVDSVRKPARKRKHS